MCCSDLFLIVAYHSFYGPSSAQAGSRHVFTHILWAALFCALACVHRMRRLSSLLSPISQDSVSSASQEVRASSTASKLSGFLIQPLTRSSFAGDLQGAPKPSQKSSGVDELLLEQQVWQAVLL